MKITRLPRLLLPLSLALLAACSQQPKKVVIQEEQQDNCPLQLQRGQSFILNLPSNPSTGFRWEVNQAASSVLRSLGPEVYTNPEDAGLVGSAGRSTWRFEAYQSGEDQLHLQYRRPWEHGVAPARIFSCVIRVD